MILDLGLCRFLSLQCSLLDLHVLRTKLSYIPFPKKCSFACEPFCCFATTAKLAFLLLGFVFVQNSCKSLVSK